MRRLAAGALAAALLGMAGCGSGSGAAGGLLLRYEKTQEGRRTAFVVAEQGKRKWTTVAGFAMLFDGDHYAYCNARGCLNGKSKTHRALALYALSFLSPNQEGGLFAKAHRLPAPPRVIGGQPSTCQRVFPEMREQEVCVAIDGGFLTYAGHPQEAEQAAYTLLSVGYTIPAGLLRLPARYTGL
jgi:hypothetical protein